MIKYITVQEWVDALRSDEYIQQSGKLFVDGGYCCLGVGCAVAGASYRIDPALGAVYPFPSAGEVESSSSEWIGDTCNAVDEVSPGICEDLVMANDKLGDSFAIIANRIESRLPLDLKIPFWVEDNDE